MRVPRLLTQTASGLIVLVTLGCNGGDSSPPPPQNTSVAGQWAVTCTQRDDDCQSFAITFAPNGDINDLNGDGPSQGMGHISQGRLFFYVNDFLQFTGTLDGPGNVATGVATDLNTDESLGAKATRTT